MILRAEFFVKDILRSDVSGECSTVIMSAVDRAQGIEDVNKAWSEQAPIGSFIISITNPAAIDAFKKGKAYYLDFSAAENSNAAPSPQSAPARRKRVAVPRGRSA